MIDKPDTLDRADLLELRLVDSEVHRLRAEGLLIERRFKDADQARARFVAALKKRYALADADTLDIETGAITRTPRPEKVG